MITDLSETSQEQPKSAPPVRLKIPMENFVFREIVAFCNSNTSTDVPRKYSDIFPIILAFISRSWPVILVLKLMSTLKIFGLPKSLNSSSSTRWNRTKCIVIAKLFRLNRRLKTCKVPSRICWSVGRNFVWYQPGWSLSISVLFNSNQNRKFQFSFNAVVDYLKIFEEGSISSDNRWKIGFSRQQNQGRPVLKFWIQNDILGWVFPKNSQIPQF